VHKGVHYITLETIYSGLSKSNFKYCKFWCKWVYYWENDVLYSAQSEEHFWTNHCESWGWTV